MILLDVIELTYQKSLGLCPSSFYSVMYFFHWISFANLIFLSLFFDISLFLAFHNTRHNSFKLSFVQFVHSSLLWIHFQSFECHGHSLRFDISGANMVIFQHFLNTPDSNKNSRPTHPFHIERFSENYLRYGCHSFYMPIVLCSAFRHSVLN